MFFLSSQINLDDPFIVLHFIQRSLAKNAPLVKHSHLTGELPYKDHVMLDNDVDLRVPLLSADHKFSITPMMDGVRIAGTVEFAGLEAPPNPKRWDVMTKRTRALLPGLTSDPRSTWLGYRPSMPDSLPVIGRSPRHQNVYYAFGHGHLGLTLGAVTGRVIADLVAQRAPLVDPTPYRIERF